MEIVLIFKIIIVLIAFIIIVKFLFSSKSDDSEYKRSSEDIKKEIDNFRKNGKVNKEYGKLMDDMMEDYYEAEEKR